MTRSRLYACPDCERNVVMVTLASYQEVPIGVTCADCGSAMELAETTTPE